MTDIYQKIAQSIIKEQETIIGPLAVDQASKVPGINIKNDTISIEGDEKNAIEKLVKQYENLFGGTSVEVCKDAIKKLDVPKDQLPAILM